MAYKVWRRGDRDDREANTRLERVVKALAACQHVETFLWPRAGVDWLDSATVADLTGGGRWRPHPRAACAVPHVDAALAGGGDPAD
ncbi:hypothetical protein HC928_21830 [bacterium]|nr:hypothetical protein [bacterium]